MKMISRRSSGEINVHFDALCFNKKRDGNDQFDGGIYREPKKAQVYKTGGNHTG